MDRRGIAVAAAVGMDPAELEQLRRALAALREPAPLAFSVEPKHDYGRHQPRS